VKARLPISGGTALIALAVGIAFGQSSPDQSPDPGGVAAGAVAPIICPPQPHAGLAGEVLGLAQPIKSEAGGSDC
jgi:hypothetical protein